MTRVVFSGHMFRNVICRLYNDSRNTTICDLQLVNFRVRLLPTSGKYLSSDTYLEPHVPIFGIVRLRQQLHSWTLRGGII